MSEAQTEQGGSKAGAATGPNAVDGGIKTVIQALEQRRLVADMNNVKGQLRAIADAGQWKDPTGHILRASPELVALLAGLLGVNGRMTIMSLFRYHQGPHGEPQPDGTAVGRAVDVMAYAGYDIHLKSPSNAKAAIAGVAEVIGNLPSGRYTLGLPRPGGGAKMNPPNDVFLPVTSLDQVSKSPGRGVFKRDLSLVLEPAQTLLRKAFEGNPGAKIQFMYPDGVDHIHIKALV